MLAGMQISSSLVSLLFSGTSSGTSSSSILSILQSGTGGVSTAGQRDPIAVLADAEKNGAKQIIAKSNEPTIRREIVDFVKAVGKATTVDQLLADPKATKVLLTANGLEEFADYKGLVAKALKSDPNDPASLANKLAAANANWLGAARTYQFSSKGLAILKDPTTIQAIADGYAEVRWREGLDASAPGVSAALSFKDMAAKITSPYQILGSSVARQVVTTALGLPAQIAYQPLESQATAITKRLDIARLKDSAFVETLVKRFLINLNNTSSGVTA